ncbi:FAD-dependent oxidoreductase [Marivibrio halodurans]|uniref:FAD-dependent oxidoreductase n=2 Tax=Marivibrio halodurans TaxID=2039722 RepID=A0A8J7V3M8_9PROT|nr:FAD-dependent oxidoreductase [Marivibrio halodurans]
MTIRNRLVMAPHGVVFMPGYGNAYERIVDYHVERAKGGIGLMVMSNFMIPDSWRRLGSWDGALTTSALGNLDDVSDPDLISPYSKLIRGVHENGAKFVSQLNASGRQHASPGALNFGIPLWAPSAIPCPKTGEVPKEMDIGDIEEFVATYVKSSMNLREAGADGVEIFAAQGYLLHEFLSPSTNRRTDRYGGSLDNRMRFLLDVVKAVRKAAGPDFVIGIRMNADDYDPAGITPDVAGEIARRLSATGDVDYLNISGMTYLQYPGWIADMTAPEAQFADKAGEIRAAVDLPVCVVSRIGAPAVAERILREGRADMVGMARALISDPEFPNKAMRGDVADIRVCTYSNQSCLMGRDKGYGVGCLHNVAVGREGQIGIGKMRPAPTKKRVAVIGGGPAGMAASRVARERGHDVILFEKHDRLGGQNLMTAAIASRRGFAEVTRWQAHMLRKTGVDIRLDCAATAETVLALEPDAVVVATGSIPCRTGYSGFRPGVPELAGVRQENVFTVWNVFDGETVFGHEVLVIDDDPHLSAAYVAEHLTDLGHRVRIVTPNLHVARDLHVAHVPALYHRLRVKGLEIHTGTLPVAIEDRHIRCEDIFSHEETCLEADSVILAMGNEAENGLYRALKNKVPAVYLAGDSHAPRRLDNAIADGERTGWMM